MLFILLWSAVNAKGDPNPSNHIEYVQIGCVKCKHSLNTHKRELIHCDLSLLSLSNMISGGGVSLGANGVVAGVNGVITLLNEVWI